MAQVNSTPGQNQLFGNVSVVMSTAAAGASDSQAKAIAKFVPYMQSEPGRKNDTAEGKRS
jgi:cytochrome c553